MMWMIATAYAMPPLSFVSPKGVNYTDVPSDAEFQQWLSSLSTLTVPTQSPNAEKAFWINVYNGLTIQTVANHMPINSIRDLDNGKVWTTRTFVIDGQTVTLDKIEKEILGQFKDPRIHAALNCASKGCPPLFERPFTEAKLDAELDLVSQRWVQRGVLSMKMVGLETQYQSAQYLTGTKVISPVIRPNQWYRRYPKSIAVPYSSSHGIVQNIVQRLKAHPMRSTNRMIGRSTMCRSPSVETLKRVCR